MGKWTVWVCPECYRATPIKPIGMNPLCDNHQGTPKTMIPLVPKAELQPILDKLDESWATADKKFEFKPLHEARDALAALLSTDSEEG